MASWNHLICFLQYESSYIWKESEHLRVSVHVLGQPILRKGKLQTLSTAPTPLAPRVHPFSPTLSHTHTPAPQSLPLYPVGGVAPTSLAQHVPVHIVNQGKPIVNVHENQLLGGDLPERFLYAQHRGSLRGVRGKITNAGGGGGGKGGEDKENV